MKCTTFKCLAFSAALQLLRGTRLPEKADLGRHERVSRDLLYLI